MINFYKFDLLRRVFEDELIRKSTKHVINRLVTPVDNFINSISIEIHDIT